MKAKTFQVQVVLDYPDTEPYRTTSQSQRVAPTADWVKRGIFDLFYNGTNRYPEQIHVTVEEVPDGIDSPQG